MAARKSAIKFSADLDVGTTAIERAKVLLRGVPKRIARHRAMLGIQEPDGGKPKKGYDGTDGPSTLAEVMRLHEFGTDTLPERSWLRGYFDANVETFKEGMRQAMRAEFQGDADAVRRWAHDTAEAWRAWIMDGGDFTGLAPLTIALKTRAGLRKPATPLSATEQFADAFRAVLDGLPA